MSTGILPSMLGMIERSSPAPVIARICDWSSMIVSTSTGDSESSSRPGTARIAVPLTVWLHPAARTAAAPQTTNGLAAPGMAYLPTLPNRD